MSASRFSRWLAGTSSVLVLALLAGCSQGDQTLSPSFKPAPTAVPLVVVTSALWDFAAIIPGVGDPEDLGTTETISLPLNGSIGVTTGAANQHITVKGRLLPPGDTERGLGLCRTAKPTCTFPGEGDEVGDTGPGALLLNFNNVLPVGSKLAFIELGSVQTGEGYRLSISTNGGGTFGAATEVFNATADPNVTVSIDLPTAGLVIKLEKMFFYEWSCY